MLVFCLHDPVIILIEIDLIGWEFFFFLEIGWEFEMGFVLLFLSYFECF